MHDVTIVTTRKLAQARVMGGRPKNSASSAVRVASAIAIIVFMRS
jgi:hypothetical protein